MPRHLFCLAVLLSSLANAQEEDLRTCLAREAERQCWAGETADFKEAARAFVDKRKPTFEGR